jgi:hypothetical protein
VIFYVDYTLLVLFKQIIHVKTYEFDYIFNIACRNKSHGGW